MENCLFSKLKEATNNSSLPYLGGIVCKLPVTNVPKRLTILNGLDSGNNPLPVTIKIEGDGTFTNSSGTATSKSINLPDGENYHWFTSSGEAYLHILPISNLGYSFYIDNTLADFDIRVLKLYERNDNAKKITSLNCKNTKVYGDINSIPDTVVQIGASKYMYGNIAELNADVFQLGGTSVNVPSLEYKGSRKGNGVNMIVCNYVDLGSDFDSYIKDCADCDYHVGDTSVIEVHGTTNYDTDTDVQNAVATVYSKGVTRIWITDTYGVRRILGTPPSN